MIAEDLTSEQIIEKNIKRINIYRDWYYKAIPNSPYVRPPEIISGPSCIYTIPNETSSILIKTLTSDDDGHSRRISRLTSDDTVDFAIQYSTTTSNDSTIHIMFSVDLSTCTKYKIIDGQGVKYVFPINLSWPLSNITNYKNIRVFYICIRQSKGKNKGNEISVIVNYTQDIE